MPDGFQNRLQIVGNIVVPYPQDAKSLSGQPGITHAVAGIGIVLPAIRFDDQPLAETNEINDVSANDLLTAEFEARKTFGAQLLPKRVLRGRLIPAQFFRAFR